MHLSLRLLEEAWDEALFVGLGSRIDQEGCVLDFLQPILRLAPMYTLIFLNHVNLHAQ